MLYVYLLRLTQFSQPFSLHHKVISHKTFIKDLAYLVTLLGRFEANHFFMSPSGSLINLEKPRIAWRMKILKICARRKLLPGNLRNFKSQAFWKSNT